MNPVALEIVFGQIIFFFKAIVGKLLVINAIFSDFFLKRKLLNIIFFFFSTSSPTNTQKGFGYTL